MSAIETFVERHPAKELESEAAPPDGDHVILVEIAYGTGPAEAAAKNIAELVNEDTIPKLGTVSTFPFKEEILDCDADGASDVTQFLMNILCFQPFATKENVLDCPSNAILKFHHRILFLPIHSLSLESGEFLSYHHIG